MISFTESAHFISPALLFALPALSIAWVQRRAATAVSQAIETQPEAAAALRKNFLLGLALSETAAILTGIMTIFLVMGSATPSLATVLGQLGIIAALGIPSVCIGIVAASAQREAIFATARQPFFAGEILRLMLITLALMQTSVILGFILAFLIQAQIATATTLTDSLLLLAAGLAFGCGTIGPLTGLGKFSGAACAAVGTNRSIYRQIMSFTFISQGLIEAPILFSLVVALMIVSGTQHSAVACIASTLAIGFSTLGPGIASGKIARAACFAIAKQPSAYGAITRTSLLAQTLIDTAPIYGMIIALALLLFV